MSQTVQTRRAFGLLLGAGFLFLTIGCGGKTDRPATVPVSGTVMYKGNPVEGATVVFMKDGAPRASEGVTDASGKYKLSTFGTYDGAIPGDYRVTVTKTKGSAAPATFTMDPNIDPAKMAEMSQGGAGKAASAGEAEHLVPEKYSGPSSPLKKTVAADGPNDILLELTD